MKQAGIPGLFRFSRLPRRVPIKMLLEKGNCYRIAFDHTMLPPSKADPSQPHVSKGGDAASPAAERTEPELVVRSESLQRVMRLAEKVARHPAAVLIIGETGTGKEMIAHTIHNYSLRCNGPFIDVNCAAIPEHLVESELFGYEKGAFSGARSEERRVGK